MGIWGDQCWQFLLHKQKLGFPYHYPSVGCFCSQEQEKEAQYKQRSMVPKTLRNIIKLEPARYPTLTIAQLDSTQGHKEESALFPKCLTHQNDCDFPQLCLRSILLKCVLLT